MLTPFLRTCREKSCGTRCRVCSERDGAFDANAFSARRFEQAQTVGMEQEARTGGQRRSLCVKLVTENGMTDREKVNAELMTAACQRGQLQPRSVVSSFEHFPVGLAGSSLLMTDHLKRAVRPVGAQRQIDMALIPLDPTGDNRNIGLLQMTALKLEPQMALGSLVLCKDHHARGRHIQPVNGQRVRMGVPEPCFHAIGFCFAGDRQHPRRFVDEDQILIFP